MKNLIFVFLCLTILPYYTWAQSKTCQISGEVIGRESTHLLLYRSISHYRNPMDTIELKNGQFEFTLSYNTIEAYDLVFKDEIENGSWRAITFFPAPQLTFKLHHLDDFDKNQIKGDVYFAQHKAKIEQDELEYYQPLNDLDDKIRALKQSGDTIKTKALEASFRDLLDQYHQSNFEMMKNLADPLAYYYLLENVRYKEKRNPIYLAEAKEVYQILAAKMPDHPYTELLAPTFGEEIWVGRSFKEFVALNLTNQEVNLKDQLNGKLTLINFWGSWCGPCRRKTREVLTPIYETYRGLGLTYLGIAREFGDTKKLHTALRYEQYPWANFYDLNDQYQIWAKYDQINTAGWTMLIDKNGIILAIDPSEAELRALIDTHL